MNVVPIYTSLRNFTSSRQRFILASGKTVANDDKGRVFLWSMTNSDPDNGDTVIRPDSIAEDKPGRWIAWGALFFIKNIFGLQTIIDDLNFAIANILVKVNTALASAQVAQEDIDAHEARTDNPHAVKWSQLSDKPIIPAGQIQSDFSQTDSTKTDFVKGKPATYPPSAHMHPWTDVTGKPTTFSPSAHTHPISDITNLQSELNSRPVAVNGVFPAAVLPSYVDDVLEYANLASFPATGETGKIYTAIDTNKIYRWSGSAYVVISDTLALGETSSSAFAGDKGKTAYDHSQSTNSNPHNTSFSQLANLPIAYPPTAHTHQITDITNLAAKLDSVSQLRFVQTADKTVATATDSTTEKSIIGTGNGSMTFLANTLTAGRTIRLTVRGVYSTPALNLTTLAVKIKLGAVTLSSGTASSLLLNATNNSFEGSALLTIRSVGTAGSEVLAANVNYSTGNNMPRNFLELSNSGTPVNINTAVDNLLDVTVQWQGAASGHTIKSTIAILETLN